jgi:hypothetical protein
MALPILGNQEWIPETVFVRLITVETKVHRVECLV